MALGVGDHRPDRDEPDMAAGRGAGDGVRERSALGGDEQVARAGAGGAQRACADPEDQVIPWMWVARREASGEEGVEARARPSAVTATTPRPDTN